MQNACNIMVEMSEVKIPLGKPRYYWKDNMKMSLEIRWEIWIGFIWLRIGTGGEFL
jgi:hypothetical protein